MLKRLLLVFALALLAAAPARAQDGGALLDFLVKKGIVSNQEAEDLRVQLMKDFTNNTSAGKMNIGSAVSDFRLSGDLRIREQYETKAPQVNPTNVTNERYLTVGSVNYAAGEVVGSYNQPHTWYATVRAKF